MDSIPTELLHGRILTRKGLGLVALANRSTFALLGGAAMAQMACTRASGPVFSHLSAIALRERESQSFWVLRGTDQRSLDFLGFEQHVIAMEPLGTPPTVAMFFMAGTVLGVDNMVVTVLPRTSRTGLVTVSGDNSAPRTLGYACDGEGPVAALRALGIE
jgi:hypothetical protein